MGRIFIVLLNVSDHVDHGKETKLPSVRVLKLYGVGWGEFILTEPGSGDPLFCELEFSFNIFGYINAIFLIDI